MQSLLADIELYLDRTGMGPAYFGQKAGNDSTIVKRLRAGGRVWPDKEAALREFMSRSLTIPQKAHTPSEK